VPADSLSQVADELYGLVPADFTAARDEHARQARSAGQREMAAEIKKLARPTASAWLVNQLVRDAPGQMDRLFDIGQSLQDAQRELAGDRMRELSAQRRQIIAELVPAASRLAASAGQPVSAAALNEVRATLEAALADPAAGTAVRSGRLTRALAYAGLGEVDLTAAMAVLPGASQRPGRPRAPGRTTKSGVLPPGGAGSVRRAASARGAVSEPSSAPDAISAAQAAVDAASAAAAQAERQYASQGEQRQFVRRRIEHLRRELDQAEAEDAQLARQARQAKRDLDAAGRTLATAQRRLDHIRERGGTG
jgi:hypothetical protein